MIQNTSSQNKKYVIFEAQHIMSLYQFITLKFTRYKDDDVIIFINKDNYDKSIYAQNFIKHSVFNKVVSFCEPTFKNSNDIHDILTFFDKIFAINNINFKDVKEIVTAADVQNLFAFYCIHNNQNLTYLEMYDNQFKDKSRYYINKNLGVSSKFIEDLSIKYGLLCGDKSNTKKRYLHKNSKIENSKTDVIIDFLHEFYSLKDDVKNTILKCFCIDKLDGSSLKNILLMNSVGWTYPQTKLPMNKHYLPFLLIADYFFNDQEVYLKDHPQNNNLTFNNQIVPYCKTIQADVPIEFLGLLNNLHINKLVSVDSTGGSKISKFIDQEKKLGRTYLTRGYFCNHKLFASLSLYKFINEHLSPFVYGVDFEYMNSFMENDYQFSQIKKPQPMNPKQASNNSFNIIGHYTPDNYKDFEQMMKNADENSIFVFFNFSELSLISYENIYLIDNIIPLTLNLNPTRKDCICDPLSTKLVVFCKNKITYNKILNFNFKKILKNIGAEVFIDGLNNSLNLQELLMQLKINILHKKIEALQKEIEKI